MDNRTGKALLLGALIPLMAGCTLAKIDVEVTSERTTLERQVLGTYNTLDSEMLMVASVRGRHDDQGKRAFAEKSADHREAVRAMQTLEYHSDDLMLFKSHGWVGENHKGLIEPMKSQAPKIQEALDRVGSGITEAEFDSIIEEVNRARMVVMRRVIETNDGLTREDLPKIEAIFAQMKREIAQSGDWVEMEEGQWVQQQPR